MELEIIAQKAINASLEPALTVPVLVLVKVVIVLISLLKPNLPFVPLICTARTLVSRQLVKPLSPLVLLVNPFTPEEFLALLLNGVLVANVLLLGLLHPVEIARALLSPTLMPLPLLMPFCAPAVSPPTSLLDFVSLERLGLSKLAKTTLTAPQSTPNPNAYAIPTERGTAH